MTVDLLPDVEAALSAYLRSRPELTANVYTILPADVTFPVVRVHRIGGSPPFSIQLYLDQATIQVDTWATLKATAWSLAETSRQLIAQMPLLTVANIVVTNVTFGPFLYLPDVDFTPAKPRWTYDVTLLAHS
jgi:hypothetical protein